MARTKSKGRSNGGGTPARKLAALDRMASIQQKVQKKIAAKRLVERDALTSYQWRSFFLTYSLYIIFYMSRKPFSTLKGTIQLELELSDADLGQIETIFLITYAASQFIIGPFGDKYGARKLLFVSLLGTAACCYGMSVATSMSDLRLYWGMNGVFQACAFPLMMKALSPWYNSSDRARMLGYWTTCQQVGGTMAVSFAGYVAAGGLPHFWSAAKDLSQADQADQADHPDGSPSPTSLPSSDWRDAFLLPAGLAIVAAFLTFVIMVEHPNDVKLKVAEEKGKMTTTSKKKKKSSSKKDQTTSFADVARLPFLVNIGASYFCIKLVRYTMLTWSVLYLQQEHGYLQQEAANMSTLFDIGGAFGAIACSIVTERYFRGSRIHAVFALCLLSAVCTASYGYSAGFGPIFNMVALFTAGFAIAGPDSVLGGAACSDVCERAGYDLSVLTTATGIANGMGSIGAILAGYGPVWVKSHYGWNGLFVVGGGLAALGAICLIPLVSDIEKDSVSSESDVTAKRKKTKKKQ